MNIKHKYLAGVAAVALTAGVGGLAHMQSSEAVPPSVYLRVTTASTPLSPTGAEVTLKSVTIPAGSWTVTAKANPVNFGAADYVRCRIMVGTTQKDAGATLLGNASPGPTGELGPSVASIALQTAVNTTGPRSFSLRCQHDFPIAGEYVDPGASLMVVAAPGPIG